MTRPRPHFEENPAKQLKLPPGRTIGSTLDFAVSRDGHVWLLHQATPHAGALSPEEQAARLPPVVEFDADLNFLTAWGGADHVPVLDGVAQWPNGVENLTIDEDGAIWLFGYTAEDNAVFKFSRDGRLLQQFGRRGPGGGDDAGAQFGVPTDVALDPSSGQLLFSDGYRNHRVVALDAATGEFRRMWGAYGEDPVGQDPARRFGNPVHGITRGPDGLFYVADRLKNRIQAFEVGPDSVRFVDEIVIAPSTQQYGSAFEALFSPAGDFMYVGDGSNNRVWVVDMASREVVGWTGGYVADEGEGNEGIWTRMMHRMAIDGAGNLLLARPKLGLKFLEFKGVW